ncbi:MAG: STM4015 family protein [Chitinophagaceae bacterium]|nr:STM4015 family protein [Chitinophagaceae bacterium]
MVSAHLESFLDLPVKEYSPSTGIDDPEKFVYRISIDYDEYSEGTRVTDKLKTFTQDPKAGLIQHLIIGPFEFESASSSEDVIALLAEQKNVFRQLKAIFIGDITYEECEISWIQQGDITPLLQAYPALEHLQVRGGDGLEFSDLQHNNLKTLIIETGGLPPNVVKEVNAARLPNLERLDMWLGSDNYGFDSTIDDFTPLLSGKLFPKLTHLGLMDSEIQDEIAIAVARSPILQQLKVLDLSMGTLTDKGAAALLNSDDVKKLGFLNLRRHYMSDGMMQKLQGSGIPVNVDDQEKEEDDHRYAEVTE